MIWWAPWALRKAFSPGRRADVIYATSPPASVLVIARYLKRLTGTPLVLDLRDPWTCSEATSRSAGQAGSLARNMETQMERKTFARADAIICNTEPVQTEYTRMYPEMAEKFVVIPNGFDPDDYADLGGDELQPPADRLRIGYFGKIYAGRSPAAMLNAAGRLVGDGTIPRDRMEFVFYGPSGKEAMSAAEGAGVADLVRTFAPVPHDEALQEMSRCHTLLLLSSRETDRLHIPAKLYEYIAIGRPVFAMSGADGAIDMLMKRHNFGIRVDWEDGPGIVSALRDLYERMVSGQSQACLPENKAVFSRPHQVRELMEVFGQVIHSKADMR
jgi:glycosyltransferase involved in cell wall biosynthesis